MVRKYTRKTKRGAPSLMVMKEASHKAIDEKES